MSDRTEHMDAHACPRADFYQFFRTQDSSESLKPAAPTTPKRKRPLESKDDSKEPLVESPYFSHSKSCRSYTERNDAMPFDLSKSRQSLAEGIKGSIASCASSSPDEWKVRGFMPNDPFTRDSNISDLKNQLAVFKPCLIQERVASDPWKLLVVVTLLNKTSGRIAIPAFWKLISKWPTPLDLSQASLDELTSTIRHLGTQTIRAKRLILLSQSYMQEPPSIYDLRFSKSAKTYSPSALKPSELQLRTKTKYPATPISHLPGTGPYALDSYRIFCTVHDDPTSDEWKMVVPTDKELIRYLKWKWAYVENKEWTPSGGIRTITPSSR
ncbi:DNA glycosylase [Crassisporium funariophilum]|nr:DNA glycosylase [Crassisporium funariophilum]